MIYTEAHVTLLGRRLFASGVLRPVNVNEPATDAIKVISKLDNEENEINSLCNQVPGVQIPRPWHAEMT